MSRILRNVHKSASRLHGAGYMDDVTKREFDALDAEIDRLRAALKQVDDVCESQCLGDDIAIRVQEIARSALAASGQREQGSLDDDLVEAMSEAVAYMGGNPGNTVTHEGRVPDAVDVAEITSDAEHATALAEIDRLMDIVPDTVGAAESPEGRLLIALAEVVSAYEGKRWPIEEE